MEMTLLTAAGLGLCYGLYFNRNLTLIAICSVMFLLARFEAMVYFAGIVAPLLLQKRYREFFALSLFGLVVVGLLEYARYAVFADWVPNTIHAKSQAPYTRSGIEALRSRAMATIEPILVVMPLAALSVVLVVCGWRRLLASQIPSAWRMQSIILLAPAVAVIEFSMLIGLNMGYFGRMQFLAFPFLFLLFGMIFDTVARDVLVGPKSRWLLIVTTLTILSSLVVSSWGIMKTALNTAQFGNNEHSRPFAISPAFYRTTALEIDKLRRRLGKSVLVYMTPDIGGVALCCSELRIIDLGLLTNKRLAHEGFGALPSIIREENPDVIEVHETWAKVSNLYSLPEFTDNYEPAIVAGTRVFLRKDIYQDLAAIEGKLCPSDRSDCRVRALKQHRYVTVTLSADDDAFLRRPEFLEL